MSQIARIDGLTPAPQVGNGTAARMPARHLTAPIMAGLLRCAEVVLLVATAAVVAAVWIGIEEMLESPRYLTAFAATALTYVMIAQRLGLYSAAAIAMPQRHLPKLLAAWTGAVAALLAAAFLLKAGAELSRAWVLMWSFAGATGLLALRGAMSGIANRPAVSGLLRRRAVIYGAGPAGQNLVAALEKDPSSDLAILGIFDDRGGERTAATIGPYRRLGNADELLAFCRTNQVDLLILALPISAESRLIEMLHKLSVLPVDIRLATTGSLLRFRPRAYSWAGQVPLLDLLDKPLADWDVVAKTILDKVVAATALVLLAPLMVMVALAIRLESRGPILFRQRRLGFNNELIEVLKFRSMYHDRCDADGARQVTRSDSRVTRVGHYIRKSSIDELPQLINVLRGELSLVGPRPHALQARAQDRLYHEVVDGYFARHKVKPGITGWAQINGWRGETDTPEKILKRVEHDLWYIENWSLLLDLYILLRTPVALARAENAY